MLRFTTAAVLSAAALTHALPNNTRRQETGGSIQWGACEFKHENLWAAEIECGTLAVPLDYADESSDKTLDLNLVKIKASNTDEPKLGSMLFNPGGPGESGITYLLDDIQLHQVITGGRYDLIGFDPRGTGRNIIISCGITQPVAEPLTKREHAPLFSEDLMGLAERNWPQYLDRSKKCEEGMGESGKLVGTSYVARDMLQIVDAVEEDGLLRYYGVSYGTLLGWTFAQMFPDRVDRMLLDGNVNPRQYWGGMDIDSTQDVQALFEGVLDACFAELENCPLAKYESTSQVLDAMNAKLEAFEPIPHPADPTGQAKFGVNQIKASFLMNMYSGDKFPLLLKSVFDFLEQDIEEALQAAASTTPTPPSPPGPDTPGDDKVPEKWHQSEPNSNTYAIRCGDWPSRVTDVSELESVFSDISAGSSNWMDPMVADFAQCYSWPFAANERYEGEYYAATAHPVLLVNPTWDNVTPLAAAVNSSETLEGSVVLEHRGMGHGVGSQASLCTYTYMRDYMVEGTLPEAGTVCEPDMPALSNMTTIERVVKRAELWEDLATKAKAIDIQVWGENLEKKLEGQGGAEEGGANGSGGNGTAGAAEGGAAGSGSGSSSGAVASFGVSFLAVVGVVGAFVVAL